MKREATDGSGGRSTADFARLDPKLRGESYARLSWAALAYAVVYASAYVLWWIFQAETQHEPPLRDLAVAFSIVFGLFVFALCRQQMIPVVHLTRVAFAFEILAAFGISGRLWGWQYYLQPDIPMFGMIPWVCAFILMFPTILPAEPRKTIVAALIAATSVPLIMASSVMVLGSPGRAPLEQTERFIFSLSYPAFIAAGVAYWTAFFFYQLSHEVSKARRLGSYQLVERIGVGGMGEVWKAKHRLLVRPAAIKLIRATALGNGGATRLSAIERFEREAQATAALGSPHTVELYDFGITDEGTFYYVMELLDGLDLRRVVERFGPVQQEHAVHILRQACHSLHDAHLTGIVHRDVKPENIFICRRGHDYDFVKVLDFGLVALTEDRGPKPTQLTAEGVVVGTPAFMAPEMVAGGRVIDPRADIYALGCVGYWLLTGQLVFEGNSLMSVLIKHAKDSPPPPSVRTEMPIHPELERLILSCLEKDPANRPVSADAFSEQLARCQLELPTWTNERSASWWQTHLPEMAGAGTSNPAPIPAA